MEGARRGRAALHAAQRDAGQARHHLRILELQVLEERPRDHPDRAVTQGVDGGRADVAGEQAALAHGVAAADLVDDRLCSLVIAGDDTQAAIDHDEQAVRVLARADQDIPALQRQARDFRQQRAQLRGVPLAEQVADDAGQQRLIRNRGDEIGKPRHGLRVPLAQPLEGDLVQAQDPGVLEGLRRAGVGPAGDQADLADPLPWAQHADPLGTVLGGLFRQRDAPAQDEECGVTRIAGGEEGFPRVQIDGLQFPAQCFPGIGVQRLDRQAGRGVRRRRREPFFQQIFHGFHQAELLVGCHT